MFLQKRKAYTEISPAELPADFRDLPGCSSHNWGPVRCSGVVPCELFVISSVQGKSLMLGVKVTKCISWVGMLLRIRMVLSIAGLSETSREYVRS